MAGIERLLRLLDRFAEVTGKTSAWFAGLMVLVACYIVVTRYLLDSGSVAIQDILTYLNALVFTLGAAYTLKADAHVRVDIFYGSAKPRTQALINLGGSVLLLWPVSVFILWGCWDYVAASWAIREKSGDTGGLPWVYLLKTLILVMAGLLIVQGLAEVIRNTLLLLNPSRNSTLASTSSNATHSELNV